MPELGVWTPQEIADEIGMSREFVIAVITGKTAKYSLAAIKRGRSWLVADAEARAFIDRYRNPQKEWYTPNDIAKAIGKSRPYILDALTGYGGRREVLLKGQKKGTRWLIARKEAEQFIELHKKGTD